MEGRKPKGKVVSRLWAKLTKGLKIAKGIFRARVHFMDPKRGRKLWINSTSYTSATSVGSTSFYWKRKPTTTQGT
jgi:hypothetical protein